MRKLLLTLLIVTLALPIFGVQAQDDSLLECFETSNFSDFLTTIGVDVEEVTILSDFLTTMGIDAGDNRESGTDACGPNVSIIDIPDSSFTLPLIFEMPLSGRPSPSDLPSLKLTNLKPILGQIRHSIAGRIVTAAHSIEFALAGHYETPLTTLSTFPDYLLNTNMRAAGVYVPRAVFSVASYLAGGLVLAGPAR